MQKTCANAWCKAAFEVSDEDLEFYDRVSPVIGGRKYSIPPPTLCPECRRQRRLAWRNERRLYQRSCDRCGKGIVSVHSPENPYPVYCNPCWRSESWDPFSFGVAYDSQRGFFEQWKDLCNRVPQRAMVNDDGVRSENCEYCFDVAYAKDCYLCFGMWKMQNCYYCRICDQSKFSVDCEGVKLGSELNYECIDSQRLYRCVYVQNSEHCSECLFGFDLKDCTNCVGCVGLRQKKFHIFNESCSVDEYRKRTEDLHLSTFSGQQRFLGQFMEFALQFPRKNMNLQNCEDCLGDHLFNCRKVLGYVSTNSEHSKWIERSDGPQWCYDIVQSGSPQWALEHITADDSYGVSFSTYCNQSKYALYSDNCLSCDNVFGCVSLRRKKYCILNVQYTAQEYASLVEGIITNMQQRGEWGEFPPIALSHFGYNETNANEFYPLEKETALARGWQWRDMHPATTSKETITSNAVPDDILDVPDTITHEILACLSCRRNYRIIIQELDFYRSMQLPVPRYCPDCRNQMRLRRKNPFKIFSRSCAQCGKEIKTTYPPESKAIVFCEECYLQQVY